MSRAVQARRHHLKLRLRRCERRRANHQHRNRSDRCRDSNTTTSSPHGAPFRPRRTFSPRDQVSTSASRGRDATVAAPLPTRGRFGELVNSRPLRVEDDGGVGRRGGGAVCGAVFLGGVSAASDLCAVHRRRARRRPPSSRVRATYSSRQVTDCGWGWYVPARRPAGTFTVLVANGNAGDAAWGRRLPERWRTEDSGCSCWTIGAVAESGGPSEEGLARDVRAARQFLIDEGVPGDRLQYDGERLGAAVVAGLATEHLPAGLVCCHRLPTSPRWDRFTARLCPYACAVLSTRHDMSRSTSGLVPR
jgi:hypothetical protein